MVFFGNVHIAGHAHQDVVSFFGGVRADDNASIGQDMVSFFGSIRLGENVSVGKDMVALFGDVRTPSSVTVGNDRVVQPGWGLLGSPVDRNARDPAGRAGVPQLSPPPAAARLSLPAQAVTPTLYPEVMSDMRPRALRIVLPGGSGRLGQVLALYFAERGHHVTVLTRGPYAAPWQTVHWDGEHIGPWTEHLEGADVCINLVGRDLNCRHTAANRQAIYALPHWIDAPARPCNRRPGRPAQTMAKCIDGQHLSSLPWAATWTKPLASWAATS